MNAIERNRYARQINLSSIGSVGQQALLDSTVLIVGMGGLGSPAAMYLAAAGVGRLIISDFDQVEDSNLQRQIIHRTEDIGELKTQSAKRTIAEINPDCEVETIDFELEADELESLLERCDVLLDCSDNFPTRFALNRASVITQTPLVSGAAIRTEGQIATYLPNTEGPCYQCLYKQQYENNESCAAEGILSPVVGIIGTMQALHAILVLTGHAHNLIGKLHLFDGLAMEWQKIKVSKNTNCVICSKS